MYSKEYSPPRVFSHSITLNEIHQWKKNALAGFTWLGIGWVSLHPSILGKQWVLGIGSQWLDEKWVLKKIWIEQLKEVAVVFSCDISGLLGTLLEHFLLLYSVQEWVTILPSIWDCKSLCGSYSNSFFTVEWLSIWNAGPFLSDFTPIYSSGILMDVGSLAFFRRHRGLLVILIFACFRGHVSLSKSTVSRQASLLCLVDHTVNLVACQNEAFRADPFHYLSYIIRCPVFLTVIFCCASNNMVSGCFLGPVMMLNTHSQYLNSFFWFNWVN